MKLLSKIIPVFIIVLLSATSAWSDDEDYFEKALTYTVEITSQIKTPFLEDTQGIFNGAGFLVDKERGWIVTNAHVASYSPAKITVSFKDEDFVPGETVYVDNYLDLAVIKIVPEKISNDKTEVNLKCDGDLKIGHPVGAFGHPWDFPYTGTKGIISGKTSHFGNQLLQTDAPINKGNSGGALVDSRGRLVGINTFIRSSSGGSEGIGLAIPSLTALEIFNDLVKFGEVRRGWLGFNIDPNTLRSSGKLLVNYIHSNSPAEQGNLKSGDIILKINNKASSYEDLFREFVRSKPGEEISLQINRLGEIKELRFVAVARPE